MGRRTSTLERASIITRAIDSVVAAISPERGIRRRVARYRLAGERAMRAAYDAARHDRTRAMPRSGSADGDLLPDLDTIRTRSRAIARDDGHGQAAVRVLLENVVGCGIEPQPAVRPRATGLTQMQADDFNGTLEDAWAAYSSGMVDAMGVDDYGEMCRQVYRSRVVDGEALVHRVAVPGRGRSLQTAWELIDSDRLQDPMSGSIDTRLGIELDNRGRPVRYWITPHHPNDERFERSASNNAPRPIQRMKGEWWNMLHVFRRERAGQSRGVPTLTAALPLFEHLHHYLDSEVIAARANANIALFIRRPAPEASGSYDPNYDGPNDDGSGDPVYHETIEPGTIEYLNDGEEISSHTPNRPGTTFDPFVVRMLRAICASAGLPYEMVVKDFGGMNYSSSRVGLLEARRGFECEQKTVIGGFCRPVYETFVRECIARGVVPTYPGMIGNLRAFMAARWIKSPWGWVDPTKEVQAAALAIESNLSTPQQEAARAGTSIREVLESRAEFEQMRMQIEDERGLPRGTLGGKGANPAASPSNEDSGAGDDKGAGDDGEKEVDDNDREPEQDREDTKEQEAATR